MFFGGDVKDVWWDGPVEAVYYGSDLVWSAETDLPVVQITGTSGTVSRDQFRAACTTHGVNYQTVQTLPFLLDTSAATNLSNLFDGCASLISVPDLDTSAAITLTSMFFGCSSLTAVPDLDTSIAQSLAALFYGCAALTDGNARLVGRHPFANTGSMILASGLTREPFLGAEGTIAGRTLTNNTLTTLATRTITVDEGSNLKLLRMNLAWGNSTGTKSIRIDRNGTQVATATGQNAAATVETMCNVGDVITYKATVNSTTTANRVIDSGAWGAWNR